MNSFVAGLSKAKMKISECQAKTAKNEALAWAKEKLEGGIEYITESEETIMNAKNNLKFADLRQEHRIS